MTAQERINRFIRDGNAIADGLVAAGRTGSASLLLFVLADIVGQTVADAELGRLGHALNSAALRKIEGKS